ncbi:hypothetical protein [Verrucomicrobium sp. BvORR034]|jgi:hypothetical protein|uniref:hypothetical protein n=1 Tax=Verrucomicrobium sp. BvORR034 TaxID=1396418 RepID=UPI000679D84C|nr:hypothetical protein [Verrucomicrobium sp. BvORR034]
MIRTTLLLSLAASSLLLSSCATTGDPNQGGLFGWSQNQADGRIAARQQHLSDLQSDTEYQQGRSERLRREVNRRENGY